MKKFLEVNNAKLIILVLCFSFVVIFFLNPSYGADSLRYVYAGKQLIESFFSNSFQPLISEKFLSEKEFHRNIDYSFPKREFFTILPNLIFYLFSTFYEDSLNNIIILNLLIYSIIFIILHNKYNKDKSFLKFFIISFIFFGHYQVTGWNIKILPETMYFCCLLCFLFILINSNKLPFSKILLLIFISILLYLIRPQGLIFIISLLVIIFIKNFLYKDLFKLFLFLLFVIIIITPGILYLDINNIFNFPIISLNNTGLADGAIISGWVNYYDGNIIYQNERFDDKSLNLSQSYYYIDLLKIVLYRLFYYVIPIRYYQSIFLNIWNLFYFFLMYYFCIKYCIKSIDLYKKNIFLLLLISILSFHLLFPITGTFRYQLSLIALIFVISFEWINFKKINDSQ